MFMLAFSSCGKNKDNHNYKDFIGTWGVEKIEYYNIDYAGNPIDASMLSFYYDPNDVNNTIQIVFRDDKSGEMLDGALDSLWLYNEETGHYDTAIYCPDTILVYTFTYSYDESESALYMNLRYTYPYDHLQTFNVKVIDLDDNSFIYENEYDVNYVEKAYLKRVSHASSKSTGRKNSQPRPHIPGSFLNCR